MRFGWWVNRVPHKFSFGSGWPEGVVIVFGVVKGMRSEVVQIMSWRRMGCEGRGGCVLWGIVSLVDVISFFVAGWGGTHEVSEGWWLILALGRYVIYLSLGGMSRS